MVRAPLSSRADSPYDDQSRPHRIVVVGGSYGGLAAVLHLLKLVDGRDPSLNLDVRLRQGVEITLIDERDGFFHTVGAPLAHATRVSAKEFWKPFTSFHQLRRPNLYIERGTVNAIDCTSRLVKYADLNRNGEGRSQPFDYLILATGLRRGWPTVPRALTQNEYLFDALDHIAAIEEAELPIAIIGGGAVGIEFAGEIATNHPSSQVTLIHSRNELLSSEPLPAEFKQQALQLLLDEGVDVILSERPQVVYEHGTPKIVFGEGKETCIAGHVIMATSGAKPITEFLPCEALNVDGYVEVDVNLNLASPSVPNHDRIFAIGDIAANQSIKRAGAALRMGQSAASSIHSLLLATENSNHKPTLAEFPNVPPMMALAVGKQAITWGGQEVLSGEDQMQLCFQNDLGWTSTLEYMGLAEPNGVA